MEAFRVKVNYNSVDFKKSAAELNGENSSLISSSEKIRKCIKIIRAPFLTVILLIIVVPPLVSRFELTGSFEVQDIFIKLLCFSFFGLLLFLGFKINCKQKMKDEMFFSFHEDGISFGREDEKIFMPWNIIKEIKSLHSCLAFIILDEQGKRVSFIPNRSFKNDDERNAIIGFSRARMANP